MRVLFTVSNWAGHYFCMVPLGWALQAAGHEVRVACPPDQANAISNAGLVPIPVIDCPDMMVMSRMAIYAEALVGKRTAPGLPIHPLTGEPVSSLDEFDIVAYSPKFAEEFNATALRAYERLLEFARGWRPDLVCYDLMADEGPAVAQVLGLPTAYFAPGFFGTHETEEGMDLTEVDLAKSRARGDATPWSRRDIDYVIDPTPASALPPFGQARRVPIRYIPYNGPGAASVEPVTKTSNPRVCIMWGRSAIGTYGPGLPILRYAVDAALAAGADVTLTTSPTQLEALGELPDRVRVLRGHPMHLLLEDCDLLVHHGSGNGLLNGMIAGVPQLSLPLAADQLTFAQRTASTGAVASVPGLTATAEDVRKAVETVLGDPGFRDAALAFRDEALAYPSPAELVPSLERRAGR